MVMGKSNEIPAMLARAGVAWLVLNPDREAILLGLLVSEKRHLEHVIRESDALAEPCPPGKWRWGKDPTPAGTARYRARSADCQLRLAIIEEMLAELREAEASHGR